MDYTIYYEGKELRTIKNVGSYAAIRNTIYFYDAVNNLMACIPDGYMVAVKQQLNCEGNVKEANK